MNTNDSCGTRNAASTPTPQPSADTVPPPSPDELLLLTRSVTEDLNTLVDGGQL